MGAGDARVRGRAPVTLCLYTPVSRGGAAWFVAALAGSLAGAGAEVTFIAPEVDPPSREPHHPGLRRHRLARGGGGSGNRLIRAAKSALRILSTFPRLAKARLRTREYVVTFYDWLPIQIAQFLWIKALGGRLTHIVHDVTPHAWRFPARLVPIEQRMQRWSYRLPDRVVTLTAAARDELARDWGRTSGVHVIPHGAFDEGKPAPLPGGDGVLLFGMLRRNKNIALAIDAVRALEARHPALRLHIAGARHVEDWGYWDACAARIGDSAAVTAEIGFVEEARLRAVIAGSSAVLLPYAAFNSASGVAILAAFSGRILITSDAGGMGELIARGVRAVVIAQPVTTASIADAIDRFCAIPQAERAAMAQASRAALVEHLSWDRIARVYLDMLRA